MTDIEKQLNEARELLKRCRKLLMCSPVEGDIEKYLQRTKPKHPAELAWEAFGHEDVYHRPTFFAGYKAGLKEAASVALATDPDPRPHLPLCQCTRCAIVQRIHEAAGKVPAG